MTGSRGAGYERGHRDRIAAAPISWGVCEAPGWGIQLDAERVLGEMHDAGYGSSELGPEGWAGPGFRTGGLACAGAFVAAVLHDESRRAAELARVEAASLALRAHGGSSLVLSPSWGSNGYDERREMSGGEWRMLIGTLVEAAQLAMEHGVNMVLHPHAGTVVERPQDIERVRAMCDVAWCIDTGHLMAGGMDPLDFLDLVHSIEHVHLKDVDGALAAKVASGELAFSEAVAQGMFVELGQGDARVAEVVDRLEGRGYSLDYVVEQDVRLDSVEVDTLGPARRNREFVAGVLAEVHA